MTSHKVYKMDLMNKLFSSQVVRIKAMKTIALKMLTNHAKNIVKIWITDLKEVPSTTKSSQAYRVISQPSKLPHQVLNSFWHPLRHLLIWRKQENENGLSDVSISFTFYLLG